MDKKRHTFDPKDIVADLEVYIDKDIERMKKKKEREMNKEKNKGKKFNIFNFFKKQK